MRCGFQAVLFKRLARDSGADQCNDLQLIVISRLNMQSRARLPEYLLLEHIAIAMDFELHVPSLQSTILNNGTQLLSVE